MNSLSSSPGSPRRRRIQVASVLFLAAASVALAGEPPGGGTRPIMPNVSLPTGAGGSFPVPAKFHDVGLPSDPNCPPANAGLPWPLPAVPHKERRDAKGAKSIENFLDGGLTQNDAAFEVLLGQGRIMTTKVDLAAKGKIPALVAVGDPTVVDFSVLSTRQIRIEGKRIGVTDLSIVTPDNEVYNFEVRVVTDLHVLRGQLLCLFPDASLKLTNVRDHVVVEGQARDGTQATKILETIQAYLISVQNAQASKTTGQQQGGTGPPSAPAPKGNGVPGDPKLPMIAAPERSPVTSAQGTVTLPKVISLLRITDPLAVVQGKLSESFPDASLMLSRVGNQWMVEGQARDSAQVVRILQAITAYKVAIDADLELQAARAERQETKADGPPQTVVNVGGPSAVLPLPAGIINRLTVPGSKQVLLKVRVAELNRTAFRQIGANFLTGGPSGAILGTQIGGGGVSTRSTSGGGALSGFASLINGTNTTGFGIFEKGDFSFLIAALRRNQMLKILAEPNLVALNGHAANFLAGGEFPVPVPQSGAGGGAPTVTVEFKKFGVSLGFLPIILDGDVIRLAVDPEVSTLDPSIGTVLVPGGSPVPGVSTRRVHTVVEMREGQTLAIAGLLQVTMEGSTQRIPGLGDVPILGPLFSNTTHQRQEKELIILVTPYLVDATNGDQVPPTPGDEVMTPSDFEFYFLNRIEGRCKTDWRSTTRYEKQLPAVRALLKLDAVHVRGPYGFCE